MPELETAKGAKSDFYFVEADEPEHLAAKLVHMVKERIPRQFGLDPIRDIQILCPMNRSLTGARSLNTLLQEALNPPGEDAVERFGWRYGVGDKVMQLEDDYDKDVFNGDLGVVVRINPKSTNWRSTTRDGR